MFHYSDREKLKRLRVYSLLDLALITPNSYENNFISKRLSIGEIHTIEADVNFVEEKGNMLKIELFSTSLNIRLQALIFHPKIFHKLQFQIGNRLFLKGKIEFNYGKYQITQPKIIYNINTLEIKYKYPQISSKEISTLIKKYITIENLIPFLGSNLALYIYKIHFPTIEEANYFIKNGFNKKFLYALKYTEILNYIYKLKSKRRDFEAMEVLTSTEKEFIKNLPFELTNDQKDALGDIKRDLSSKKAKKRIIMGDVGSGKTILILSAVTIAYPHKSILMTPTTILANQIYQEAKKFLSKEIRVAFVTNKSKEEDLTQYDFIIGTHALLYRKLPKAPLIMVDEQHKFGTNQREAIKKLVSGGGEKRPHFLQFSATPIPRTLSMINSFVVNYSFLKETPFKREIETKIINRDNFSDLINHIKREIELKHQIIIVYPLVEESESINYSSIEEGKEYWLKRFKNVYITSGKDKNKERVIEEFRDKGDILLATTVVEVGISLPKLSTIVIVAPERLGLASLHQLRGRVSRNGLKGYCFLFTKYKSKRLEEFIKTKDGFEVAELDLKYRDSGDLFLGDMQSGKRFKYFDFVEDRRIIEEIESKIVS